MPLTDVLRNCHIIQYVWDKLVEFLVQIEIHSHGKHIDRYMYNIFLQIFG